MGVFTKETGMHRLAYLPKPHGAYRCHERKSWLALEEDALVGMGYDSKAHGEKADYRSDSYARRSGGVYRLLNMDARARRTLLFLNLVNATGRSGFHEALLRSQASFSYRDRLVALAFF